MTGRIGEAPAQAKFTLGLLFTSHDYLSVVVPIVTARRRLAAME